MKSILSKTNSAEWILILSLLLAGGFHEFIGCILSVVIAVILIIKAAKNHEFKLSLKLESVAVAVMALFYLISVFYAVDSGMAFTGFLKFLPVLLYTLLLMQDITAKAEILAHLPFVALILGIISLIAMFIPSVGDYFISDGRPAGFFQYSNTYALFLLICELIVLGKKKYKIADIALAVALIALMLTTGSRAVFVLAVGSNAVMLFLRRGKRAKIITLAVFAVLFVCAIASLPLLAKNDILSRYLNITLNDNTLLCRLLYYADSLPVILKHPLGLGYMGYYYAEQTFQTGIYSIKYIHNDFLQILLDIGWVPFLAFCGAVIKTFFSKKTSGAHRVIVAVIVLHALFDFDLQYISMFFILLLFMDLGGGKEIKLSLTAANTALVLSSLISLYFALALSLAYFGAYGAADDLYPLNTQNKINLLIAQDNAKSQAEIADDILSHNKYVKIAYSAKARAAYSEGDFGVVIENKNKIFEIAPFADDEYEEYCYMLIRGMELYEKAGNTRSVSICKRELISARDALAALPDRQSRLGRAIRNQPNTSLPEDVVDYINALS